MTITFGPLDPEGFRLKIRPGAPAIMTTNAEVAALKADVARLQALVKDAEQARDGECAWCGAERGGRNPAGWEKHGCRGEPCPAFTPDGSVR